MRILTKLLILIVSLFVFTNCTPKVTTSSNVKIQFAAKGVSAQSLLATDIDFIVVNVSGPGIEHKIVEQKDCHDDGIICDNISIEVPTGQDRLIQLLVVTKDDSGNANFEDAIFYGDTYTAISGDAPVPINLSQVSSFQNEADFSGQYIPSAGHALAGKYLSGSVDIEVAISGKPDMTLGSTEILGGWFNLFLAEGIYFRYFFWGWDENANPIPRTEIFDDIHGGVGFEYNSIPANGRKVAHFSYSGTVLREEEGGNLSDEAEPFEKKIVAFLGASLKNVCYDHAGDFDFQGNGTGTSLICKADSDNDGTCDDHLSWYEISDAATDSSFSCAAGIAAGLDVWELDVMHLEYDDEFVGFRGLFAKPAASSSMIDIDPVSHRASWETQQNIGLLGMHVFVTNDPNIDRDSVEERDMGEGYDCNSLEQKGFVYAGVAVQDSAQNYHFDLGAAPSNDFKMIICPLAPNGTFYKSAYYYQNYGPGPGAQTQLIEFKIYDDGGTAEANHDFGWARTDIDRDSDGDIDDDDMPAPYVISPKDRATSQSFFVEVKNITTQDVDLTSYHIDMPFSELSHNHSASTGIDCGPSIQLSPGQTCKIQVAFTNSPAYAFGSSIHSGFTVKAEYDGDPGSNDSYGFPFIATVPLDISYGSTSNSLNFFIPDGEMDVKTIKINNSGNGSNWDISGLTGSANAQISFDTSDCGGTNINNSTDCFVEISIDNTASSYSDGNSVFSSLTIGTGSSADLSSTILTQKFGFTAPGSMSGNTYSMSSDVSTTLTDHFDLDNFTSSLVSIQSVNITGGGHMSIANDLCSGSIDLSVGSQVCDFDIDSTNPGPIGLTREWLTILYEMEDTYRDYTIEIEANYL